MAIGGVCMACKKYSPGLFRCAACASQVCPNCVMPGTRFCVICKGQKQVRR